MGGREFPQRVTAPFLDVVDYLLAHPGAHGYAIRKATGNRSGTVYAVLDRLVGAKWVTTKWVNDRRYSYVLTAAGEVKVRAVLAARRPPHDPTAGASGHAEGLVVVACEIRTPRLAACPAKGWTLHVDTCSYLTNKPNVHALPAPAVAYPNTRPCRACRPGHPHRRTRSFDDRLNQFVMACACGDVARGPTSEAARSQSKRNHHKMAAR